jgi:hypothetical protein
MAHPHKNREELNTIVREHNGVTYVSREQVYPMVSNNYKKRKEPKQEKTEKNES